MSQENVEIMRRVVDATNRGDFEDAVADVAPEFEFVPSGATIPGFAGVHRGLRDSGGSLKGSGASSTALSQ